MKGRLSLKKTSKTANPPKADILAINDKNSYSDILAKNRNIIVNVSLVHDKDIKSLNGKYLQRDYPTDVLSFSVDQIVDNDTFYLGDIVVNVDQAVRQAPDYNNTLQEELSDLVGHGVLHLLGVHHDDDDEHSVHGISVGKS